MSPGVIQVRADICGDCPTPCGWQHDAARHSDPCSACHISRWSTWGDCRDAAESPPPSPPAMRGLGDLIAKVAEPIAKTIGLDKRKCGCAKRQEALNKLLPFR